MRLFEDDCYWIKVNDGDENAFQIFTRHYTFRKWRPRNGLNGKRMAGPGETIVLIGKNNDALFIWKKQKYSQDGQTGINCAVFRNEGPVLSSVLLNQAEKIAADRWPGQRLFTYVNPRKIKSNNPGYCFKVNGWHVCGISKARKLIILEKQMDTSFQGTSEKGTDTWLTPRHILEPLGHFDLDPACPELAMPWTTADRFYTPIEDGLKQRWEGRIYLNPPYGRSGMDTWMCKMANHGNGIALVYSSTEVTTWFVPYIWNSATAVLFIAGRVKFCDINGQIPKNKQGNDQGPGKGSVLVAYSDYDAAVLKLASFDKIPGKYIQLK